MFPNADLVTSHYDPKGAAWLKQRQVRTTWMQHLPLVMRKNRMLTALMYPYAFESLDLTEYDTVISVTSSFAKGCVTRPETRHLCILLTPTRYLWFLRKEYAGGGLKGWLTELFMNRLREWDLVASSRPDTFLGISRLVAERCQAVYRRECQIAYPPFDPSYWEKLAAEPRPDRGDDGHTRPYFLVVSRLEPYKRIEVAIEATRIRGDRLIIVGRGSQSGKLRAMGGGHVTFYENIDDHELARLYRGAEALLTPQEEDFGYVALEALACGCPVITASRSGIAEIVQDGTTGLHVKDSTPEELAATLAQFREVSYNIRETIARTRPAADEKYAARTFERTIRKALDRPVTN
jgi:glycosyltransferase involved in cell wall biosynthesis